MVRDKRGERKATLSVTGRDIENQEIVLGFLNCRWLVSENPLHEEMEQEKVFEGSATELSYQLEEQRVTITPSKLSRQIKQNKDKLKELEIAVSDGGSAPEPKHTL